MDPLLTRILLTTVLWPVEAVAYFLLAATLSHSLRLRDEYAFVWAAVAVGFLMCTWLILLWRPYVRWTAPRRWRTFLSIPAAIGLGLLGAILIEASGLVWNSMPSFLGCLIALSSWPIMVLLAWRETSDERQRRTAFVSCPNCGYNLQGLSESRCPECGHQSTLDQLYAAQPRPLLDSLRNASS